MTGHREALDAFTRGAGAVPAGPGSETVHPAPGPARIGRPAPGSATVHARPLVDDPTAHPRELADPTAHREALDVIRAELADAIRARVTADTLTGHGSGPTGGPRGLLAAALPAPAADLLAHVTGGRATLDETTRAELAARLVTDARAALASGPHGRPQGAHGGPTGTPGTLPDPFTVQYARAALVDELARRVTLDAAAAAPDVDASPRPDPAADARDRHACAILAEHGPTLVTGRPVHTLQLADGRAFLLVDVDGRPEWRATGPRPLVDTLAGPHRSPKDRRHGPAPTTTDRRPGTPRAPETSAAGAYPLAGHDPCQHGGPCPLTPPCVGPCHAAARPPARSGLAPLGVDATRALVDAAAWSEEVTARALATLTGPAPDVDDAPPDAPHELAHDEPGPSTPGPAPAAPHEPHEPHEPRPLPGQPLPAPTGPRTTGPRPHTCGRPHACQHEPQEAPPVVTEHHAPGCPGPHPLGTLCHGPRAHERAPWPTQDRPAWLVDVREPIPPDPLPQDGPSGPGRAVAAEVARIRARVAQDRRLAAQDRPDVDGARTWTPAPATVAALAAVGIDAPRILADLARARRSRERSRAAMRALRARARARRAGLPPTCPDHHHPEA